MTVQDHGLVRPVVPAGKTSVDVRSAAFVGERVGRTAGGGRVTRTSGVTDLAAIMRSILGGAIFGVSGRLYIAGALRPRADVLLLREIDVDDGMRPLGRALMTVEALELAVVQGRAHVLT